MRRVLLLYAVILSIGGIPLIYLGDELGTLNDYGYRTDPAKAEDSRWVHRPATDWVRAEHRHDPTTPEGRVFGGLTHLIHLRQNTSALADGEMEVVETGNGHVFGYVRHHAGGRVLALVNLSEREQRVPANQARLYGLGYSFTDLISGQTLALHADLTLAPYRVLWLTAA